MQNSHYTSRRLVWLAEIQHTFKKTKSPLIESDSAFILILQFICKADKITTDPTYTSRIIVPLTCLNILLYKEHMFWLNSMIMSTYLCHYPRDERKYLACSQDESISVALLA